MDENPRDQNLDTASPADSAQRATPDSGSQGEPEPNGPSSEKSKNWTPVYPKNLAFLGRERDDKPSIIVEVVEFVDTSPLL